jgi:TM2 domain-containing membrane protein YozV
MPPAEPLWRVILNWGLVVYFLGLPAAALIFGLAKIHIDQPGAGTHIAQFLANFHLSVSALLAAIAGLNSFDRYKTNGKSHVTTP